MIVAKTGKPTTRPDWEAIERDYRLGKLSLRELEAKHGVGYASISRKATKSGWTKDLRKVVRQATTAAVLQQHAKKAQQELTTVVVVAAEANKQVILKHRTDIEAVRTVAIDLLGELAFTTTGAEKIEQAFDAITAELGGQQLAGAQQQFKEFMRLHSRIGSAQKLADTLTKLQVLERKAFDLDAEGDDDKTEPAEVLAAFVSSLHSNSSGRLAVVPRKVEPKARA